MVLAALLAAGLLERGAGAEGPAFLVRDIETTGVPREIHTPFGDVVYEYGSYPNHLTAVGEAAYFTAFDWQHGRELWKTDGTREGTLLVRDICAGECWSDPRLLGPLGETLLFLADDGMLGRELWRTDGTAEGTVLVKDLCPGPCDQRGLERDERPRWAVLDGILYFAAWDEEAGGELWRTDGTADGTWRVRDICPGACSAGVFRIVAQEGRIYFDADDRLGSELWRSDGTASGTRKVTNLCSGLAGGPGDMISFASRLFFISTCNLIDRHLYATDGTAAGTERIVSFPQYAVPQLFAPIREWLYFKAWSGSLWRTDGTPEGTHEVARFARVVAPAGLGHQIVFPASATPQEPFRLYISDGTPAGTRLLPGGPAEGFGPFSVDGRVLFYGDDGATGKEPWITDGTEEGTRLVQDIAPGAEDGAVGALVQGGNFVYFAGWHPETDLELWALDRRLLSPSRCFPSQTNLCLQGNRFEVTVHWRNQHAAGVEGEGAAAQLSDRSGTFWFFNPANIELITKVLDGRTINGSFWFFWGALSDVEYWITVKDLAEGTTRLYHSPPGEHCGGADTGGFPAQLAQGVSLSPRKNRATPDSLALPPAERASAGGGLALRQAKGSCEPAADRLCLQGGRLAVTARWRIPQGEGTNGPGTAVASTEKSGFFWFFNPDNIELVVKALDGRAVNGKFWFFYGHLSNVEYWITLTDTVTGASKTYHNPPGRICGDGDTAAL